MSASPWTYVVFGTAVENAQRSVIRKVTKYDENTGKPYEKEVRAWKHTYPDWVLRLLEERQKFIDEYYDEELYEKNIDVAVHPIDDCESRLLVGKLLLLMVEEEKLHRIELPDQRMRTIVSMALVDHGVRTEDIGLYIGTAWR